MLVIEMNPRVSRSSALASKATGFPIARIGTKLAVGYRLDEIPNDITKTTPASFEPVLDYVVVKVPRFAFEKFPSADPILTTQMKSVGEAMAIGRTFKEAFQKGLRGLETGRPGGSSDRRRPTIGCRTNPLETSAPRSGSRRRSGSSRSSARFELGASVEAVYELTGIDPWFLYQLAELLEAEAEWQARGLMRAQAPSRSASQAAADDERRTLLRKMKRLGFSDRQLADLSSVSEADIRARTPPPRRPPGLQDGRHLRGRVPVGDAVSLPAYDEENEAAPTAIARS